MNDKWLVIFHSGPAAAILQCLPAVGKLKQSTPDCLLAWVTNEYNVELIMETSMVDKVIVHPAGWHRRGLVAWIRALVYTGKALRKLHPIRVFDFSGKGFKGEKDAKLSSRVDYWILAQIIHPGRHSGRRLHRSRDSRHPGRKSGNNAEHEHNEEK